MSGDGAALSFAAGAGLMTAAMYLRRRAQDRAPPLPPLDWTVTPADIKQMADKVLEAAEANLTEVAAVPDSEVTFDRVIYKLMLQPNYKTNPLVANAKFLQHCSTDPAVRAAANEAGTRFTAFKAQSRRREDVFAKVRAYAATTESKALNDYNRHFVDSLLADFKRGGLGLDAAGRDRLQRLLDEDSELCAKYSANLAADTTELFFAPEELDGMSPEFVKEHMTTSGKARITLKYPDIVPIMSQCHNEKVRQQITHAREVDAFSDNLELVAKGIGLRKEIAKLLGYDSWAAYVTEERMSGSPEAVEEFLTRIGKMASSGLQRDLSKLASEKAKHLGVESVDVKAWDVSYYHDRILKAEFGVDSEAIRAFFPLDHVVSTTMDIYQHLLSLKFVEIAQGDFDCWHKDVRLFVVYDTSEPGNKLMGHFYLDLHPRPGKYTHAAIFHLIKRSGDQPPVDCMLTNLPASKGGKPALLDHGDVVTFFHEFGHIMHGLCAEGDGNATHLAKCPRDFVEAPSQMLENWCWQASVLARLSKHHETGKALPTELIDSMIRAKNAHVTLFLMRQLFLASLDMHIHGKDPPSSVAELISYEADARVRISGVESVAGGSFLRTFGHMMKHYSASYYGYMWAEVISADMFATRFEADCMDKTAGMDYRKLVLAPGGMGSIKSWVSKFLGGREPSEAPFLKSRGIV